MNNQIEAIEASKGLIVAPEKTRLLDRLRRFLLGHDVFVSYSRADAAAYALGLASELTKKKLTCYVDQWGAPPGKEIPAEIKSALKRSSMLVLVGTQRAAGSIHVGSEVQEFLRTGRPILPITFAGSLQKADWFSSIMGLAMTEESPQALESQKPSENVVTRIVNAEGFTRRDKRLRQIFLITALGIVLLVVAGALISWKFRADGQKQQKLSAANLLTSKAFNLQDRQPDLALLLALESHKITDSIDPNILDARTGLFELLLHTQKIGSFLYRQSEMSPDTAVAFSHDGQKVAAGNFKGTVSVWNVNNNQLLPPPDTLNQTTITSLAFSRDGNLLACGRGDGSITIWDENAHKWIKEFPSEDLPTPNSEGSPPISALAFGPDTKTLAIGRCGKSRVPSFGVEVCDEPEILFIDPSTEKPKVSILPNQHKSAPTSLTYSTDGKTLISGAENDVSIFDLSSRKVIRQVPSQSNVKVQNVAFGKDGKVIAAGVRGENIIIWDLDTDEEITQPLTGHQGYINDVALSTDGTRAASVGDDQKVILWDTNSYGVAHVFLTNTKTDALAISSDGKLLATGREGVIDVWDVEERKPFMSSLKGHTSIQRSIAFSPNNKLLASPAIDSGVILWDLTSEQQIHRILDGKHGFVWQVSFSPDGKTLAAGNADHTVSLWDTNSFQESILKLDAPVYHLAFSPDSKLLAIGTQRGRIVICDMTTSESIDLQPNVKRNVNGLAFSPDNKTLAASLSFDRESPIMLWDVPTRSVLRQSLTIDDAFGGGLSFNKDGSLIIWLDTQGVVKLWHVGRGQLFARIPTDNAGFGQNLASTPDGRLITHDEKGTIVFWDWNINSWISRACRVANRTLTPAEREEYLLDPKDKGICSPRSN